MYWCRLSSKPLNIGLLLLGTAAVLTGLRFVGSDEDESEDGEGKPHAPGARPLPMPLPAARESRGPWPKGPPRLGGKPGGKMGSRVLDALGGRKLSARLPAKPSKVAPERPRHQTREVVPPSRNGTSRLPGGRGGGGCRASAYGGDDGRRTMQPADRRNGRKNNDDGSYDSRPRQGVDDESDDETDVMSNLLGVEYSLPDGDTPARDNAKPFSLRAQTGGR